MEHIHIAALRPNLDALESKQIKAVVTLIWPYSSSQRQFALLLAEPDLGLRRKKGQVRARFSATSARALATTGVGVGDEVVLSLHGAQFVQDGAVSTPGKSLDWELAYAQTLAVSVRRNGVEMANLEMIDAAPTPAPRSPVKKPAAAPSPIAQWSSPAFLKRARLSDGPFFEQPAYDPLADESNEGHDKKRRRKSYRDWTAWTYTARTPSPEKEDVGLQDEWEQAMSSPSRPPQLPKTPISPSRTGPASATAEPLEGSEYIEETTIADSAEGDTTVDDGELQKVHVPLTTSPSRPKEDVGRDADYYELYSEPNEGPPLDSQYDFGGDTELNTEDEDEDEDDNAPGVEEVDASATELATELEDEHQWTDSEPDALASQPVADAVEGVDGTASATEEDSLFEVAEAGQPEDASVVVEDTTIDETVPEVAEPSIIVDDSLAIAMPPPSLPVLHTDFATPIATGILTPIGKEPSSPNLKAVDSATLPLPSPFPGEQAVSYFDYVSTGHHQVPLDGPAVEEQEMESDADYIMENSFFSSISSSKAGGPHQDHETAFAPVRFTFGLDGAGWSRPLELSSPPPEDDQADTADNKDVSTAPQGDEIIEPVLHIEPVAPGQPQNAEEVTRSSPAKTLEEDAADALAALSETAKPVIDAVQPPVETGLAPKSSNVIAVSSDVESDESEYEDAVMVERDEEQSPEQETESESEEEAKSESDEEHETESLDLGSPSAHEVSDDQDDNDVAEPKPVQAADRIADVESEKRAGDTDNLHEDNFDLRVGLTDEATATTIPDSFNFDDFLTKNVVQEPTVVSSSPDQLTHEPASIALPDTFEEPPRPAFDDWEPQVGTDEPLSFIENDDTSAARVDTEDPDVKMESVEDDSLCLITQPETQNVPQKSGTGPATELLIGIPENGHKLGELQFKSVPATAAARNTRSKAKSAASPPEENAYVSRLSTSMRRTRSKASFDSTNRDTTSPSGARVFPRSTVTPTRDATQTSPYSLRSQSKHMSPDKSMATSQVPVRRSPRKLVQRDTDFDIVPSQGENRDVFGSMFEPSQELGFGYSQLSQGRNSDVGFVKDSEEDTSHSEGSISTVQYSDGDGVQACTNMSDSVRVVDEESTTPRLKPPPASLSQTQRQNRSRSRSTGEQSTFVSLDRPPQTPRRSPRLTRSTFSTSLSPRTVRTRRAPAQITSPALGVEEVEDLQEESTPKVNDQSVIYPVLPIESEGDLRSSPLAPSIASVASRRSSPAAEPASAQQLPLQESNLLTPDDTQQTALEPPLSFQARQPDQSLLITPELTQMTDASATLRSFDIPMPGVQTQPAPHSPITRTSPRRKPAVAEERSSSPIRASSPMQQSSEAISELDEDATLVQKKEDLPSIGLSTPMAYYTPLRDLIYFLNRSSQFHSSSNPDVLALCTSASTTPEKAKKGPRHWNTTLHITDLSVWPEARTVNIFRAYQNALPMCETGDVILLRAFGVESRNRQPLLRSQDESSWCVWRYCKPVWGTKKGKWGELRAREEVKGPVVERGEGEWTEVGKLRNWYMTTVKAGLDKQHEEREGRKRETRSWSKGVEVQAEEVEGDD
ncbi:hypothetical protein BU25DRAFT_471410 [Macroventuria anomochaeta]|uniref:Uncharacterized protein n=1 Tax=Macroventuria anomochaeta TaxID=301207 RepID=A0ACB6RXM2_9PLEO|nr:uncharacterized protein BU25DRAFT_471410 [Macroventuria anomochaeta]KAF2626523.1 hypothetical protein BU25DRAFT_471410 [Macroventuria anomochaeta]